MKPLADQKEILRNILQELKRSGIVKNRREFLAPAGISESFGSVIFKEGSKTNFPPDRVALLLKAWNINPDYWYGQKGEMILNKNNVGIKINNGNIIPETFRPAELGNRPENTLKVIERHIIPIPIVEKRAQAGYPAGHYDPEYVENLPKIYVSKEFEKGNYLAFEVSGDSMDDDRRHSVCDGDVVLAKELDRDLWRDKLHFGKYLFVVVYNEGCVIKQITNHNTETGEITCHSFNPFYEDFTIKLDDVFQLLYVVKIVDKAIRI